LRILITNNSLAARAGTELYVRDLALGLLKRGHTPIAYSTKLGDVATEIRAATVPVIDNLDAMGSPPDVIHGQHHLSTMTALLHFPQTPAIYFCHGWAPWEERPPKFPRILRYAAVDYTCRDRLIFEAGIPEERTCVLLNFADLERFKSRGPLPERPQRALVLSNNLSEQNSLGAVQEACARAGIELDVLGRCAGNACAEPEAMLGNYDLVFAKGRAALEAMAVGTAVVLCDVAGLGPMVTTANIERLRPLNFGIRSLRNPVHVDALAREMANYDPIDALQVSHQIRESAGRELVIDELIGMYQDVIDEHARNADSNSMSAEQHAAAGYLRELSVGLNARDGEIDRLFNSRGGRLLRSYGAIRRKLQSPIQSMRNMVRSRTQSESREASRAIKIK
jgi:hypothetical protein